MPFDGKDRHGFDAERPAFIHLVIQQTSNSAICRMPLQVLRHSTTTSELSSHVCTQSLRHVQLFVTLWPTRFLCPCGFSVKNTGLGCHFLLQGVFPTQGSNQNLLHPLTAGRFFTTELSGKPLYSRSQMKIAE